MSYLNNIKILLFIVIINTPYFCVAQESNNAEDLAQKLVNPLASLPAMPIQNNIGLSASGSKGITNMVSFQPIFPFKFEKFNLINRLIFGFGYVPGIVEGLDNIPEGGPENGEIDEAWGLTDLDVNWLMNERRRDLYDWNGTDIVAMINDLKLMGNKDANVIITMGKGIKLDGTKHPHSWSIMENKDCFNWIEKLMKNN